MSAQKLVLGSEAIADLEANKKLDTSGLVCPYPSFETAKVAQGAGDGDVIEIVSDDKYAALNSLPTVLRLRNFEYAVIELEGEKWLVKARRAKA